MPRFVKLGDFGIVKWGDFKASISTGTITVSGQQGLGTLKYMPPEQAIRPKEVGVKADMWSFGATLFELFSNQILSDVFHVMELREIRQEKSSLDTKLNTLGLVQGVIPPEIRPYEDLIETIFNCFLRPTGRPSSTQLSGRLKALLNDSLGDDLSR